MARQQWMVYLGCLLCGLVCVWITHSKYEADLATTRNLSAQWVAALGYVVSFLVAVVLGLFAYVLGRHNRLIKEKNLALEELAAERTRALYESQEQLRQQNENLEEIVSERTQELVHQAFHDSLTGLPNRANALYYLNQIATRSESSEPENGLEPETGCGTAVLFLDLDNFKFINDSLGHRAGDELLIAVSERLRGCVRPTDLVARLGGDEFIVVQEMLRGVDTAVLVAQKILEVMSRGFSLEAGEGFTTVSVGIAYNEGNFDADVLIRDADTAMYHAKAAGKANYALFEPGMNDRLTERVETEVGLRIALLHREFCVHYQPLIDLKTGHLAGVEALVRWQHPKYGLMPPGKFIPIAEETGLIVPIGYWVLEEACRQTVKWMQSYSEHGAFTINVNLSGKQLQKPDVVECIQEILDRTGMPRGALKLEITESVMMADALGTIEKLKRLRALGVKLAMDDFGTGYSSMASLSSFPLDTGKIDRAFVNRMNSQSESESVIAAIIMLAKSLHLDVTGEGIENPEQVTKLQGLGCDIGQGYYFSRPLNAGALEARMTEPANAFVMSYSDEDKLVIERLLAQHIPETPGNLPKAA